MGVGRGKPPSLAVIGVDRLRQAVDRAAALQAVERAFRALDDGARLPPPFSLELPEVEGEVHAKGAWLEGAPIFALKVATGFYRNSGRGLPTGSGLVLVFDAGTGFPLAVLDDGGWLTELRTGAAGALAVRHLAPPEVRRMAVIGTGVQARFQLRAIADVRRPASVVAWGPDADHLRRYCEEMREELDLDVAPAGTVDEAVEDAELVVTVTPSRTPLVRAGAVAAGATLVAVGSDGVGKQELEAELLGRADKVVVDHLDQCARLGELQHALAAGAMERDEVYGTLTDIVVGRRSGREADEMIVCDLTGVGVQDAAIAEEAWRRLGERDGHTAGDA